MKYHEGEEKLVVLNGDHELDSDYGPEVFDQAIYWAAARFIKTLRQGRGDMGPEVAATTPEHDRYQSTVTPV